MENRNKKLGVVFLLTFVVSSTSLSQVVGGGNNPTSPRPTTPSKTSYDIHNTGRYADFIIGGGHGSDDYGTAGYFNLGVQTGTRKYFTKGKVYRPGLDIRYAKLNLHFGGGRRDNTSYRSFTFGIDYGISLGFANGIKISENVGIEIILGLGIGYFLRLQSDFHLGIIAPSINSTIKCRIKNFSIGIDANNQLLGFDVLDSFNTLNAGFYGISIGRYL